MIHYKVQYYSHKSTPSKSAHPSRKGVWVREFGIDKEAADKFAGDHRAYGRGCVVEEYEAENDISVA